MIAVRPGTAADEPALLRIDRLTWSTRVSPSPPPGADAEFFAGRVSPDDVLVAERDGDVVGYLALRPPTPMPCHAHVLEVVGLAVDPAQQGSGVGRALVSAAVAEARRRGARRLTLRVLGPNAVARRLYESAGFVVEGVLRGEFLLDGEEVDDVLMARRLG